MGGGGASVCVCVWECVGVGVYTTVYLESACKLLITYNMHHDAISYFSIFIVDKMAEGPDPAIPSSQDKSSGRKEQEPVVLTSGSSHDVIASKDLVQTQQSVPTSKWCQEEFKSTVSQEVPKSELKGYLNFPQQPGGPCGIAVAPNGHTFIADFIKHQIHVFDEQRKYIRSFSQLGSGNGQLQDPLGVAVDAKGLVYVSNFNNNRIEVLQEDGTFVRHFGVGHIAHPQGVAVNKKLVYVAELSNHKISIFTLEGQLIPTIRSRGSGPGQFNCPSAVAFSPDGDMYVAEYYNHRIQVFNSDGVYQREFGGGQVKNPLDILITADGHVLVADCGNKRVIIFNTTGQLIHSFEVPSPPYGLAIDHNGDLLVTLPNDKQVAVYSHYMYAHHSVSKS